MMPFYRYFQRKEKETWSLVEDTDKALKDTLRSGAKRISILALNTAEKEFDQTKVSYRGPFYADIDNKDSLPAAITSAKELVDRLLSLGLEKTSFEVYASGSKGFHVLVHEKAIYDGRAKRYLPLIYKYLAIDLFVPGMDYAVYCTGKGNLFRPPNVQREDGKYKVRLLPEELQQMDEAKYRDLCSRPRTNLAIMPMQAPMHLNPGLAQMFASAEARWKADEKERVVRPVADANLNVFISEPPQCVRDLSEGKTRTSINFNRAAYQMGIYLARSGTPTALANSLMGRMASLSVSSSYSTERERVRHLQGLHQYLASVPRKQFSCPAIRGTLTTKPCDGCALHNKTQSELEEYEIEERLDGYYIVNSQQVARRLTSFILVPHRLIHEVDTGDGRKRSLVIAEVRHMGEPHGQVRIHEASWEGRGAFVSEFRGIANLMVRASDNDIQTLKHFVLRDIEDIEDQTGVTAVGIHREKYGKRVRYTYVEEGLSINRFGVRNTHTLDSAAITDDSSLLPDFKHHPVAGIADPGTEAFMRALFNLNSPEKMGALLGWFSACHLKAHLMGMFSQFPLINVWGGIGSGKTKTASLLGFMSGCDYLTKAPPTMAGTTLYPVYALVTSSTTVPRILDEFNITSGNSNKYDQLTEAFKAAYNANAISRGTLSGKRGSGGWSARAQNFPMRGPICLLGEQPADRPALSERCLSVELNQKIIPHRRKYMDIVAPQIEKLIGVGKKMMIRAINVDDHWVKERLDRWATLFPQSLHERVRYNLEIIGLGLDFLEEVLVGDLRFSLSSEIAELKAAYIAHYTDFRKTQGSHTQSAADRIVDMWADQIMLSAANPAAQAAIPGSSYRIDGPHLLIDLQIAYAASRMYATSTHQKFEVASARQLLSLLSGEPYYVDYTIRPELLTSRPVIVLDMNKMTLKGLEPSKFMN